MTPFGTTTSGDAVHAVALERDGLTATVLTHGARLHSLQYNGSPNLAVGADTLAEYEGPALYRCALVAPVVNRIAGATTVLDGEELTFSANEGAHCLHSGPTGTQALVWDVAGKDASSVNLTIELPHGLGGFPGNRHVRARYALENQGAMRITIEAVTDRPTFMNPAFHGGWNLDGVPGLGGHRLRVAADTYVPVDAALIPTGTVADLAGTTFDLRELASPDARLDHNYCLAPGGAVTEVAELIGASGRRMVLRSDAPGLQVFCGDGLGIALEPQIWPDAPNQPAFPSILLRPGETFQQESLYTFST